jgi:Tfp pilus assembly ATPase PilU
MSWINQAEKKATTKKEIGIEIQQYRLTVRNNMHQEHPFKERD